MHFLTGNDSGRVVVHVNKMQAARPGYFLAVVISVSLASGLVSFKTVLMTASLGGILVAFPVYLINAKKLPQYSSEKVRLFLEKINGSPIAHRGGTPENTLAAVLKSKREGAVGVEMDLAFTKDGHAVLLHDATVNRTSDGTGLIDELTLEEARKLDFGSHSGVQFANERIPTLKEAVALCKELDLVMFIEIKSDDERAAKVITDLFSKDPEVYDRVAIVSFFPRMLYKLRLADPNILCGFTFVTEFLILAPDGVYEGKAWWRYLLSPLADYVMLWSLEAWLLTLLGVKLLLPYKNTILRKWVDVERLREQGMYVLPWTVNDKEEKNYFRDKLKVPYVTDVVALDGDDTDITDSSLTH